MNKTQKLLDELKTDVAGLKIRIRRIETFLLGMPNAEDYIQEREDVDELLEEAKNIVAKYDRASASLLQRRLGTGYARAARLLDLLEKEGIVGAGEGAKPREVLKKSK
ncbi:hypothetical protein A3J17_03415 [Candidatus Curtissbacteria bacterium RIFCSPLOWO2_02_FULL_40_11]|nr:MAG: hypothetical protein A3J17_03415 [Candidatus Curtissbacteria bacterium RIFCSPLOWO2_02_FULL_40_11]